MIITQTIKIDFTRPAVPECVSAVQGEDGTRVVRIELYAAGAPWQLPAGHDVSIRYGKPDGTNGSYDTLPDKSAAWSSEGNTVSVILCPQMLTCPGTVHAQVCITVGERLLSTFAFYVVVEADPSKGAVKSENYHNWRKAFLPQTEGAKVGQYLQITEVDAEGRVIKVKPVDAPSGGYGGGDLDMKGCEIDNVGTLSFAGPDGTAANGAWLAIEDVVESDDGVVSPVIKHYSNDQDAPVIYRNIAPGVEDRDAANVGQLKTRLIAPIKAAVGQYIRITAVDENGAVTAVEAVDAPSGGGGADEVPTKNSQLENDSDYAPRSELPKAFYVEYFEGELNKSLEEIGEAYNAGSVVFGAFIFSDDSQFVAIMTYFFAEEGFIAAIFNGWSAYSVKRQVIIQVTDEGSGISVDINDDATFAVVGDIPATLPNHHVLLINGVPYDGTCEVDMTAVINTMIDAKLATIPNASGVNF